MLVRCSLSASVGEDLLAVSFQPPGEEEWRDESGEGQREMKTKKGAQLEKKTTRKKKSNLGQK